MEKESQIGMGQLATLLLTSRLSVAFTGTPTRHQVSHGSDFLLSLLLQAVLILLMLLPVWWFARRTQGAGLLDYSYLLLGRRGAVPTALYALFCLYVLVLDLLRFNHFVSTTLSPDMSRVALCLVLVAAAFSAAFYGLQALARAATVIGVLVGVCIVFIALSLLPEMEGSCFPPLLYDGVSPVISGALEELPRTAELAIAGLLWPYVKGRAMRGFLIWNVLLTVALLLIQTTMVGVLGDFSAVVTYPYYTAVTAARASVLQRLDILAAAIWLAALFVKLALFALLFLCCIERLLPGHAASVGRKRTERRRKLLAAGIGAVLVTIPALLLSRIPLPLERAPIWWSSVVMLLIFAVLLPLLLTLAETIYRHTHTVHHFKEHED